MSTRTLPAINEQSKSARINRLMSDEESSGLVSLSPEDHLYKPQQAKSIRKAKQSKKNLTSKPKRKRLYQKIQDKFKNQLIHMVVMESFTISSAAKQLNLKYASAKTIMFQYRHFGKGDSQKATLTSNYKTITSQKELQTGKFFVCTNTSQPQTQSRTYDYFKYLKDSLEA